MPINRVAYAVLALACVGAAGGGAYLAVRQSHPIVAEAGESVRVLPAAEPTAVTETEAVIERVPEPVPAAEPVHEPAVVEKPAPRPPAATPSRPRAERPAPEPVERRPARPASPATEDRAERPVRPAIQPVPVEFPPPVVVATPPPPPPVPERIFEDLEISADSVLGLQIDTAVTSEEAQIEDRVEARVTRDVTVGGDVAIPAGSRVTGSVTLVEKGGKVKERARLGIRFHTLVLADGSSVALSTETLYRDGESPTGESTAKIGGAAVGGAILGAIFGGGKGATIGGAVGAGAGTAAALAGDRNAATLPAGSTVTVRILSPVTVTIEK